MDQEALFLQCWNGPRYITSTRLTIKENKVELSFYD
jgi:hypothetical protein